ncbi:translation initiation factor IF-2-like [Sturnira hondurensis]|uniref:translation initiation factor IF-2-like n=1 Tax=Sturnira hondurensis TaxID=192404 RepID=UPI00187AE53F|nr:translation initiation factor IF-2-like [Sturnira hondurensis]
MNTPPRRSGGPPASGTVPRPGPGRRRRSPSASGRARRPTGLRFRAPTGRGLHAHLQPAPRPTPGAQDPGPEKQADATRGQLGLLPSPGALHHQRRRENEAESMWEASEGRRRQRRDPSRARVSGVREEDEAGSAGSGSRASVGAAAPRRWRPSRGRVAAPTHRPLRARVRPTSQYRTLPLVRFGVTHAKAGPMGSGGGRASPCVSFFSFPFSNKISRREDRERLASGNTRVQARLRTPGGGRAVGWAPPRSRRPYLCARGGRGARGAGPLGRTDRCPVASVITRVTQSAFSAT